MPSRLFGLLPSIGMVILAVSPPRLIAQTVRDSAGIRVARYLRSAAPIQRWTIDPKPVLEIGGAAGEGPSEFAEIRGLVRFDDGRIAVANGATNEIRIFASNGAFQIGAGRAGQGPGEFRRLLRLFRFSDTLAGVDGDSRIQVFAADGRLVRSLSPIRPADHRSPQIVGVLQNGAPVVAATRSGPQQAADDVIYSYAVFRTALADDTLTELLVLPGYREVRVGQAPSRLLLDGEGTVTARAARICAGFSSRYDLTCYDASGMVTTRITRETAAVVPTDSDRSVVRNAYLAANRDAPPRVREQMERAVQEFRFADRVPAFSRLRISSSNELWVSEFDPTTNLPGTAALHAPARPQRWSVFSLDGRWLSDIVLPARFVAHDMGRDYVAGVSFDVDGVERVTVLRVRR